MGMILTITGLFAGIGVFVAAMYSFSQIILLEGRARIIHAVLFVLVLAVMAALMEREVPLARILAGPLFVMACWAFAIERRWNRIMPLLIQIFALVLMLGYVAL